MSAPHPRTAAIEEFIELHYARVVGSVTLITGDRSAAEDAVQEALVRAWRRRGEPIERLAAWVTVVASNVARDRHRRAGAEQRAYERAGADDDGQTDQSDLLDTDLLAALAVLPLRERQAAVLFYVEDLSVADVAVALDVSDGTVKTLLSRARSHLAQALGGDAEGGVA